MLLKTEKVDLCPKNDYFHKHRKRTKILKEESALILDFSFNSDIIFLRSLLTNSVALTLRGIYKQVNIPTIFFKFRYIYDIRIIEVNIKMHIKF